MAKCIFLLALVAAYLSNSSGLPVDPQELDKATANDVAVNTVHTDKKPLSISKPANTPEDAVYVLPADGSIPIHDIPVIDAKPTRRPGVAVARIIDDIFQIPISVLQSVAKLLRNPFATPKTPETVSNYK